MSENISTNESGPEKILNQREVLNLFEEMIGDDYEIVREEEDEVGLKRLDVVTKDENGDQVKYDYTRDDNAGETVMDVVYFDGDMPCGGQTLKKYKEGKWVDEV